MKSLNWALAIPIIAFGLSALLLVVKLLGLIYYPRWVWLAPVGLYAVAFVAVAVHCWKSKGGEEDPNHAK